MQKKYVFLIIGLAILIPCIALAQTYYSVQFTDKNNTEYSLDVPNRYLSNRAIERRSKYAIPIDHLDIPVNRNYLDSLVIYEADILYTSKWLNSATILLFDTTMLSNIRKLSFVQNVQIIKRAEGTILPIREKKWIQMAEDSIFYGKTKNQIEMLNLHKLQALGFQGGNKQIAVLDNGFFNVDTISAFDSIRSLILGTYNFVDRKMDVYRSGTHGTAVFSTMAAQTSDYTGTAPKASYWLFRTEDDNSESRLEIENWIAAVEYADSLGVDIITSSLGYSKFDDVGSNFTYTDMDGKTARNSIVANVAARKGILLLNSAGNDGNNEWKYISSPADADSIITVGSVTASGEYSQFSSIGTTFDGRIKPTVCAQGTAAYVINALGVMHTSNGTSFSTPIMAGAVASLWSALPDLSNMQIYELLIKSSSQYAHPDSLLGYGIPDIYAAYNSGLILQTKELTKKQKIILFPNPAHNHVSIQADSPFMQIQILDTQGRVQIAKTMIATGSSIDISELQNGIYVMLLSDKENTVAKYLIKQ